MGAQHTKIADLEKPEEHVIRFFCLFCFFYKERSQLGTSLGVYEHLQDEKSVQLAPRIYLADLMFKCVDNSKTV